MSVDGSEETCDCECGHPVRFTIEDLNEARTIFCANPNCGRETAVRNLCFVKYHPQVKRISLKRLRNKESAEGAIQETFMALFSKKIELKPGETLDARVGAVARNKAIDRYRKEKRRGEHLSLDMSGVATKAPNPEETLLDRERQDLYLKCLRGLLPLDQELIVQSNRGESLAEISAKKGIRAGTLRMRYLRAKRKLGECVKKVTQPNQSATVYNGGADDE